MKEEYVLTEKELKVVYEFVDTGVMQTSYRKFFGKSPSNSSIYRWFKKPEVKKKILEVGQELEIYDTVCDKVLLNIITSKQAENRDKISAIKTWNDLRNRTHTTIKLETQSKIDFKGVKTEDLEVMVNLILGNGNTEESGNADN